MFLSPLYLFNITTIFFSVWGIGFLCVTLINLCALLGMVFIPLMARSFYKRLLMFMVALGVGTLTGSSLLFLIPEVDIIIYLFAFFFLIIIVSKETLFFFLQKLQYRLSLLKSVYFTYLYKNKMENFTSIDRFLAQVNPQLNCDINIKRRC